MQKTTQTGVARTKSQRKASLTSKFRKAVDENIIVYPTDERAEARKQGQARTSIGVTRTKPPTKSLPDFPVLVIKGVLRTVGSKLIFAYFCSATKVGRRRQNKVSKPCRVPTKRHPPSSEGKSPSRRMRGQKTYALLNIFSNS